ncbi:odorant receptor 85b-like isoform X2 [Rhodnius prolixus]|uniref:odorant receptor 85b-like isoform X2 n=1 Tax=Rhodnius prolixus TaxID=13249 RepID=UPI003D18E0A7
MSQVTENLSPVKQCYRAIRFSGLLADTNNAWYMIFSVYHMVMINYIGVAAVLEILLKERNLLDFVQALSVIVIYVHDIVKAVNIFTHQKGVKQLLNRLEEFIQETAKNEPNQSRKRSFRETFISIYIKILIWLPSLSLVCGVFGDYMTGFVKPHLPYQIWIPWSLKEFWPYMAGMVFVTMLEFTTCVYYMSFTVINFTFSNELSSSLRRLQERLETKGPADKTVYEHHNAIIQLLLDYNQLFSGPLYVETLMSSLMPCGFFYLFIKIVKSFDPLAFELILKAIMCAGAPYVVCSCVGQEISDQMEQLHRSAYASNWCEEPPRIRKNLLTLMIITTKRIDLNYRKFVSFNHVCLATERLLSGDGDAPTISEFGWL